MGGFNRINLSLGLWLQNSPLTAICGPIHSVVGTSASSVIQNTRVVTLEHWQWDSEHWKKVSAGARKK